MIIANKADRTAKLLGSTQAFKPVFNFLNTTDLDDIEVGRHDITDQIFTKIQQYNTKAEKDGRFESHLKYLDFQYIISGSEEIRVHNPKEMTVNDRHMKDKDVDHYVKYTNPTTTIVLHKGDFALFFPEDAHECCLDIDGNRYAVKKAVIKVPTSLLMDNL